MKNFSSKLSASQQAERLLPPQRRVKAVLDTDAYNEIDDQFAILYAMLSPEKSTCRRFTPSYFITAAPPLRRTEWKKAIRKF